MSNSADDAPKPQTPPAKGAGATPASSESPAPITPPLPPRPPGLANLASAPTPSTPTPDVPLPPRHGSASKTPLPLLSRSKLKPPRVLDPKPAKASAATSSKKPPRKTPLGLQIVLRLLAWGSLIGIGITTAHLLRETQIQGLVIAPPGFSLPEEVLLVRDFSPDIATLHEEFRLANDPFTVDLQSKQDALARVQGDLTGLSQRKELLTQEETSAQRDIETIAANARAEADQLWKTEGAAIDNDYTAKRAAFRQALADRAEALKLSVDLDPDALSPEIWVNSFRLALYNPPSEVKAADERAWLEKQLVDWNTYEKSVETRRDDLKAKTEAIRNAVGPKIDEVKSRIDKSQADIAETDSTAAPLQSEMETLKSETEAAQLRATEQQAAYTRQLFELPDHNVLEKFPLDAKGRFHWKHIERRQVQYPPGKYQLWIEVMHGTQKDWVIVPFTVKRYTRLDLVIKPNSFRPAVDLLK